MSFYSQFTAEEIVQRAQWEEFLQAAEITKYELIGEGVTKNYDIIKGIVADYLSDDEINAVLARKDLIVKEIEKLVKQNGEDKVLY
jgi:hypothetical protein